MSHQKELRDLCKASKQNLTKAQAKSREEHLLNSVNHGSERR